MAHTLTESDFTTKGDGDLYYTGPLDEAKAFIRQEFGVTEQVTEAGIHEVLIAYDNDAPTWETCAEWGRGATAEEAWRFVLAAAFGPLDEEFTPIPLTLTTKCKHCGQPIERDDTLDDWFHTGRGSSDIDMPCDGKTSSTGPYAEPTN